MSQISPPIRIVLAASLMFIVAWFVFLRPGPEAVVAPTPAPGSGLGNAVQNAKSTAAKANAAAAKTTAQGATATGAAATTTGGAAPSAAKPAAKPKGDAELGLPPSVQKAVDKKKTLVMLFWNRKAFDDQAVRRELRKIDRDKGQVKVHVASIKDVARYASITRGVNLEQSPTVVVTKGDTADALVGYVDAGTINQSISDVVRSSRGDSGAAPDNPYLSAVHGECLSAEDQILGSLEYVANRPTFDAALDKTVRLYAGYEKRVKKLRASKKHKAFKRDLDAYNAKTLSMLRTMVAQVKATNDVPRIMRLLDEFGEDAGREAAKLHREYRKLGLHECFDEE